MATFSKSGFKTLNYNSFRPRYPQSFYKQLVSYANGGDLVKSILDIGCGTGIATYDMLNIAEKVVGNDLSPSMVETCNSLKDQRCKDLGIEDSSRIHFEQGNIDTVSAQHQVSMITAAQCLHWSKDFDSFFKSAHQALAPGGTLAYWYYVDPIIVDFKGPSSGDKQEALQKAKDLYFKYCYNDPNLMGPYWEQPGRNVIKNGYKDINCHIPEQLFTEVTVNQYFPQFESYTPPSEQNDLALVKLGVGISDLIKYLSTYSGYHNYLEAHKDSKFLEEFELELKLITGWTDETTIDLVWNTGYTFMKKTP